jgi:class 3 adenylate cyclase
MLLTRGDMDTSYRPTTNLADKTLDRDAMADARVQRRLAAIFAADVAGYSRLMGNDEEGTLAALKACRRALTDPKVAEHSDRQDHG